MYKNERKFIQSPDKPLVCENLKKVEELDDLVTLFYPELLSDAALEDLKNLLSFVESQGKYVKIHVLTFFCSIWIF
jgi:hypothetical protein